MLWYNYNRNGAMCQEVDGILNFEFFVRTHAWQRRTGKKCADGGRGRGADRLSQSKHKKAVLFDEIKKARGEKKKVPLSKSSEMRR
jgi:hypothetical protein